MSVHGQVVSKKQGSRRVRKKAEEAHGLSITSLLDVLTIILVFLIKNVSMETTKISELEDMIYPQTITNEKLMENPEVVPVKMYQDKILFGIESLPLGTPDDMISDANTREAMKQFFLNEMASIPEAKKSSACLVVQADAFIRCVYVTEIIRVATHANFPNIYFATIEDPDWLSDYRPASIQ
ncbi:MAG: biopolymer transporter ExbD [Candidatus Cloacimonetes bacterium]|nr:biopolymer transporter ExbD [Candidatus Cloacimonadota bacterium]MDD4034205.1 biopolymer transporter ExbD [Candidatus Cloacimonadota bacterium]MDD4666695.1 biopolymer transporter ExbD [Candidatus Cloacimonadota bacterium]